jgi:hypothetical protein
MDEKVLFYIVVGIIYFIFSRLKKKPGQETEYDENNTPDSSQGKPTPVSFEDLLREITEGKVQQNRPIESPKAEGGAIQPAPAYTDYDDEIEDELEVFERNRQEQERVSQVYEQAKKQAFSRPSLEESLQFQEINSNQDRFKTFEKKVRSQSSFLKDLKNREGFKRALIASEILNRKQF